MIYLVSNPVSHSGQPDDFRTTNRTYGSKPSPLAAHSIDIQKAAASEQIHDI